MYRVAVQKGVTDDLGGETGVLAMEPGAVARQIRGRFHLDETNQSGAPRGLPAAPASRSWTSSRTLITAAPDWPADGKLPSKTELLAQATALTDRSAIVSAAAEGLKKLDPIAHRRQGAHRSPLARPRASRTKQDAKLQRAVVDAIRGQYDAFAENVDQLQRKIGGNDDEGRARCGQRHRRARLHAHKAAIARFMAPAEATSGSGVTAGNPPATPPTRKKVIAMPDGKEKTDLLQAWAWA